MMLFTFSTITTLLFGCAIFSILLITLIISILEHQRRALVISSLLLITIPTPIFYITLYTQQSSFPIVFTIAGIVTLLIFLFPKKPASEQPQTPQKQIDERTVMFSRACLQEGSTRKDQYYTIHPEHRQTDDLFRKKPGLLSEHAGLYSPLPFAAAKASFTTVEALHQNIESSENSNQTKLPPEELTTFLKQWTLHLGAEAIGITYLKKHHLYSHIGRGKDYGQQVALRHKYAIAITIEMDHQMVNQAPYSPIIVESSNQYQKIGAIAIQIANFLKELGYPSRAHIDGNYRVVCPLVARDAGLGELGRMGLLITPRLGPRVRIAVITTDAPLSTNTYTPDLSVTDFCNHCKKCATVCPSQAIPHTPRKLIHGALRWQINQENCYSYWCTIGTDCGRCMSVCPYAHPDNLMHNMVRFAIRYSWLFRRIAIWGDDLFYGKKPRSGYKKEIKKRAV